MKQNIYDNPDFFNGYMKLRESGITYNDFIEQPAMKKAVPVLEGKTVLDLGCGDGSFSKYCAENKAAAVTGIDISKNMIKCAEEKNAHERVQYTCMPMEEIGKLGKSFDLIVSSLAIHYIEDYDSLIKDISKILKSGGEFVFSTEHPISTARKEVRNWITDEEGNRLHWAMDHYQEEGKRELHWYVDGVVVYHRTIATLINTLIKHGLMIQKIIEPQSTEEGLEQMPKLHNEKRRPSFIIIKSKKI